MKREVVTDARGLPLGTAVAAANRAETDLIEDALDDIPVPLVRLLGWVAQSVRCYGAVGYGGPGGSARTAEAWAARGFAGVKAKIGYPTVAEDVAVIRAVRRAVGPAASVMVDYNQCLTPAEAVERVRVLDGEGPTLAHDYAGHALVRRAARTPIQCGENWWGVLDLRHAVAAGASDRVMLDVMKIGGVTGWQQAAAVAHAHGLPVSSHLWPEVSARLLACTPTADWLEYADWWNPVLADPLRVEIGMATPDDAPGSGVAWNEAAVARYAV